MSCGAVLLVLQGLLCIKKIFTVKIQIMVLQLPIKYSLFSLPFLLKSCTNYGVVVIQEGLVNTNTNTQCQLMSLKGEFLIVKKNW